MKITVLTENTAKNDSFKCEHGLSLYIKTNDKKILFDAGQSDIFLKNSKTLGIDLRTVDLCILSHGHYDHGGGLKYFLEINNTAPIYINENAFEPHYNGKGKYIGLDPVLKESKRLVITNDICKIDDNMKMLARIFIILGTLDQCEETEAVGESCDGLCILDSGIFRYGGQLIELHIRIADGSYKVVDIIDACGWILRVVAHICISESLCFPDIFLMNATAMGIFATADSF